MRVNKIRAFKNKVQLPNYPVLLNITIQNIVLIEKLAVNFGPGLCVLSGETGSGKSIVLDSLGLAIGERSNSRLLRQGCQQGMVVAQFDISENQVVLEILNNNALLDSENKNHLTLKRILFANQTSKAFCNDIPISLNLLKEIGENLIEIHGQNEQRGLLNSSFHRHILDQFAGNENQLKIVAQKYQNWQEVKNKLADLHAQKDKNEREIDYLSHIVKELEASNLRIGEEEKLTEKRNFLNSRTKISNLILETEKNINDIDSKLSFSAKNLINNQNLSKNLGGDFENDFEKVINLIDEISIKNEEVKSLIDRLSLHLNDSNETLEEIEERLFLIRNLGRKFNKKSDELPEFLEKSKEELNQILNYQIISGNLEKTKEKLREEYLVEAFKLRDSRKKAAIKLSEKTESELSYLKMGSVKFLVEIKDLEEANFGVNGVDSIKFLAAINNSSNFDQINKIASGGELSRFMLALKVALLEKESITREINSPLREAVGRTTASTELGVNKTLIFDEIDSGIGGSTANAVGERLKFLSDNLQIIVVTHHAQVAAKSSHHLKVRKEDCDGKVNTVVEELNKEEKEHEIARMLSGEEISEEAKAAAKKLINFS